MAWNRELTAVGLLFLANRYATLALYAFSAILNWTVWPNVEVSPFLLEVAPVVTSEIYMYLYRGELNELLFECQIYASTAVSWTAVRR